MIVKALPDAKVEVKDLAGDDNHYAATITSSSFGIIGFVHSPLI